MGKQPTSAQHEFCQYSLRVSQNALHEVAEKNAENLYH